MSASQPIVPAGVSPRRQVTRAARRWVALRRMVQYSALFAFVALFVWSRRGGWPGTVVNLPMRVDPLAMLAQGVASRTLLAGSAPALIIVIVTLALGRAWCGWLCPMGTLLDLFSLRQLRGVSSVPRSGRGQPQAPPDSWRAVKYGLLLTILMAALLGSLTLTILDPLAILLRSLSTSIWPAVDHVVTAAERGLYQFSTLRPAVSAFDAFVRPKLLPPQPAVFRLALLYGTLFAGIVALNALASRFWCRYLCPLGALLGALSKVGLVRREVNARCSQCQACARVCPTGTITAAEGFLSDPGECTMCLECYSACPQGAVEFRTHLSLAGWRSYDPSRRQALLAIGAAVAGASLFHHGILSQRDHPRLIRPPGARGNSLLSKCIRCGQCSRACPTSAIQPAITEGGLEGLWTPVLVPRIGYCDYSCHACGQVCPVHAIPALSLEEKRQQVVGQAYIDHNRCIAWADHRDCIVCEEMCPVPQKAIILREVEVPDGSGQAVTVKVPEVVRERCIGCGTCENKCPRDGEAAIRVRVPDDAA